MHDKHCYNKPVTKNNLRSCHKLVVPRFNNYYMKNSVAHRGYYQNANTTGEYARKVRGTHALKNLDFDVESLPTFRDRNDIFIVYTVISNSIFIYLFFFYLFIY